MKEQLKSKKNRLRRVKSKSKQFDVACSIKKDNFQENFKPQIILHDAILLTN